jgi:hypothetical protein
MALGSTHPLIEMRATNIFWEATAAGAYGMAKSDSPWRPTPYTAPNNTTCFKQSKLLYGYLFGSLEGQK